jgi:hypothetical protein
MSTSVDDGGPEIDLTQDLLPWMEKQWDDHQRTQAKALRRKFNPGPHADQYERQEASLGKAEYRRAFVEYLTGPDNRGMVNFAKAMAGEVPREPRNGNKVEPYRRASDRKLGAEW